MLHTMSRWLTVTLAVVLVVCGYDVLVAGSQTDKPKQTIKDGILDEIRIFGEPPAPNSVSFPSAPERLSSATTATTATQC